MDSDYFAEQLTRLQHSESTSTLPDPDMPPLEPIAASSSQTAMDVDDNREQHAAASEPNRSSEIEMSVEANDSEDPPLPELTPIPAPTPRPNNRRARVEDDHDDERDRRHPSQRLTNPSSRQETRASSPLPAPRPHTSAFPPPSSAQPTLPNTSTSGGPQPTPSTPQPRPRTGPRHPFSGLAISFDLDGVPLGPTFTATPTGNQQTPAPGAEPAAPGQGGGQTFADLFSNPAFLHDLLGVEPDVDDPERADRLLKGLDEVPIGLVKRLEKVGGIGATGTDLNGGDSGCAVCWEKLLVEDTVDVDDVNSKLKQKAADESKDRPMPRIVSLPCAHVFHADCLKPWFSRPKQTTCPTCRFNIDPENLTFVPYRQRQRRSEQSAGTSVPTPTPPVPVPSTTTPSSSSTDSERSSTSGPSPVASGTEETGGDHPPEPIPGPPPRRAGSEPPLNRTTRPPTHPDVMGAFTIPGGHVVIVSHPIHINAQGRSVAAERGQQAQQQSQSDHAAPQQGPPAADAPSTPHHPASTPAESALSTPERPVYGPPPPPSMAFPTNLPDGVIAFDIAFPIPASLFSGGVPPAGAGAARPGQATAEPSGASPPAQEAQNNPPRPTVPPLRFPGGAFAGLNFGRPAGAATGIPGVINVTELFRSAFQPPAANPPAGNNAQPPSTSQPATAGTTTPPDNAGPSTNSTPTTAPSPGHADGDTPPPAPQQNGAANASQGTPPPPPQNGQEALLRLLIGALSNPSTLLSALLSTGLAGAAPPAFGPTGFGFGPGGRPHAHHHETGPKKEWSPPPPPGPTLRQRIEKREREAGLRCSDISCGIGPSDDEPYISEADAKLKQLSIHEVGKEEKKVCDHLFHSSCLVSAERVALRGADASTVGGDVAVSCPVCRGSGSISKSDWDEGVYTLQ